MTTNRLRTPRENGATLIEPPWNQLPSIAIENRRQILNYDGDIQGRSLTTLIRSARSRLIDAAIAYTARYRDISSIRRRWESTHPSGAPGNMACFAPPILLAGHQPELFHPGVWYKTFALGRLVDQLGGIGVNLLIDSDIVRSVSIRVPVSYTDQAQVETIPFDRPAPPIPYEERRIIDPDLFDSFGRRVADRIRPLVAEPLMDTFWPYVTKHRQQTDFVGACLAGARHELEGIWGSNTLELPISQICNFPEFHWFIAHILARLPRFMDVYNTALAGYRTAHHLRNRAHPIPDLACQDEWLEAPFWSWSAERPQRQQLFVRDLGGSILISDRSHWQTELSLTPDGDADTAVDQLGQQAERGIRIRSRALMTTLFSRIFLGDLFLHGIGGAKYDRVTDEILQLFFGIQPPVFAAFSATLQLPIHVPPVHEDAVRQIQRTIREIRYHPERFLHEDCVGDQTAPPFEFQRACELATQKRSWIARPKTPANACQRHQAIESANLSLQPFLALKREALLKQYEATRAQLRSAAILHSREYAFCLHPYANLALLLLDSWDLIA